jgi:hypothetical protein
VEELGEHAADFVGDARDFLASSLDLFVSRYNRLDPLIGQLATGKDDGGFNVTPLRAS